MRAVTRRVPGALVSLVAALLLAASGARATEPEQTLLVDAPLVLSARPASSGVGTEVLAWPAVRTGALFPVAGPFVAGGDLAVSGTWASSGTDVVSMSRLLGGVDVRGLAGLSFGGRFARVTPYLYGSAFGAAGPSFVHGGASDAARLLLVGGFRGGLGALFDIGWVGVRSEVGGGVMSGKPEITASVGIGLAL